MKKFLCCVLIILLFTGCAFGPSEEVPDTAPPFVKVDGHLYWIHNDLVDAPAEELWAGTVTSVVPYNTVPKENDQSNNESCLNQPYAFIDGGIAVRMENIAFAQVDGTIDYGFDGWFKCEFYE